LFDFGLRFSEIAVDFCLACKGAEYYTGEEKYPECVGTLPEELVASLFPFTGNLDSCELRRLLEKVIE